MAVGREARGGDETALKRQLSVGDRRRPAPEPARGDDAERDEERGRGQHRDPGHESARSDGPSLRVSRRDRGRGRRRGCAHRVLEGERQVGGGLEAIVGVLLERASHHPLERRRDVACGQIGRIVPQERRNGFLCRVAAEGPPAAEHLVQHDAEREEIAPRVGGPAPRLLRRHVRDGAHHYAWRRRQTARLAAGRLLRSDLRDPEVENLDDVVAGDEHVFRLQVAVDDSAVVRCREPAGDLQRLIDGPPWCDRAGRQALAQRVALEQLRDGIDDVVRRAEFVDREDVRVRERGDCLGFALEARQRLRIPREQVGQQLDRHVAIEPRVARAIDLAHASRAEGRLDDIWADASAGAQWHGGQTTRNEGVCEILEVRGARRVKRRLN